MRKPPQRRAGARGFTLIELMVTVAVIGILGGIAYPSYLGQIAKGRRADAKAAMLGAAQAMERFYSERATYVGSALGAAGVYPAVSTNGHYSLVLANQTAAGYTLRANPVGVQAGDACGSYAYDQTGTKGVTGTLSVSTCW